jgi:transcriptional regulator of NAD metabolism
MRGADRVAAMRLVAAAQANGRRNIRPTDVKELHIASSVKLSRGAFKARTPARVSEAGDERRRRILEWMRAHRVPISGTELARRLRVSRQCLVQDVAILRAAGEQILATPRGYRLPDSAVRSYRAILASRHEPERTEEELQILADHGVKVLDVLVEHPLYGELRGALMLESRADVRDFMERVRAKRATLLSALTRGVHLHTVEASRPEMIERAKAELRRRGFLLK